MSAKKYDIKNMLKYTPGRIILRGEPKADLGTTAEPGQIAVQNMTATNKRRPAIKNPKGITDNGRFGTSISIDKDLLYVFAPTVGRKGQISKPVVYVYKYVNGSTDGFYSAGKSKTLPQDTDDFKYISAIVTSVGKKKVIVALCDDDTISVFMFNSLVEERFAIDMVEGEEPCNESIYVNVNGTLMLKTTKCDVPLEVTDTKDGFHICLDLEKSVSNLE